MTLRSNSRVAGYAFLLYIAAALTGMVLSGRASSGEGNAARLASIASHLPVMRTAILLELVGCFCALVLAVTLYAITRDADPDLALLAMVCRVAEGVIGAVALPRSLGRLWLATARERTRRTPRPRPRSAPTCSSCRAGARPCPRPSSPSAARSSPGCSCAAGSFPPGSRGWAWSRRSWSSSAFRCSSSGSSEARSRTPCGCRCSPSSCCSRSGSSSGAPRSPRTADVGDVTSPSRRASGTAGSCAAGSKFGSIASHSGDR